MRKYGIWFHENDDSKSDYVGKCQSNWMQFSFAILRRKNQTKSNLKSINKLQHEIVGNLNLNCIIVKSTTKFFFKFCGLLRIPKL